MGKYFAYVVQSKRGATACLIASNFLPIYQAGRAKARLLCQTLGAMKTIFKVAVRSGNKVFSCDGIHHDNKLWLVLEWNEDPEREVSWPDQIIRFDNLPHQSDGCPPAFDYVLNVEVPASVLDGTTSEGFETQKEPQILFPCRGEGSVH
jgi:hypothetical protein